MPTKTNFDYLREAIDKGEDASEWIEAIEEELSDLKYDHDQWRDKYEMADERADDAEDELEKLKDDYSGMKTIDTGYGTIEYRTNNLKLQGVMEELAGKLK